MSKQTAGKLPLEKAKIIKSSGDGYLVTIHFRGQGIDAEIIKAGPAGLPKEGENVFIVLTASVDEFLSKTSYPLKIFSDAAHEGRPIYKIKKR